MEILLYSDIYSWTAEYFIQQMNDPQADRSKLTIRVNSDGGIVQYGWGIIAKFNEFEGEKEVKIDGKANSMSAFFPCYADYVEALDVSSFVFHRGAYPDWYERDMSDESKKELTRVNKHLEAAFRAKVDVPKFEEITGVTVKKMFSMDSRIDVPLTAQQAKQIGLVDKIVKITPEKKQKIQARTMSIAAKYSENFHLKPEPIEASNDKDNFNPKITPMNIEKLRAEHPEVFAQVVAQGVTQERDRVGAWAVFNGIDPEAVVAGIKSGENITQTAMAEFQMKMGSKTQIEAIEAEGAKTPKVETPKVEDKELSDVEKAEIEALKFINVIK